MKKEECSHNHKQGASYFSSKKPSKLAFIVSMACAVHCLISPLLVVALPFLGHVFHNMFVEIGLLAFSIAVGMWIIYHGYCRHKKQHAVIMFSTGVLFWVSHIVLELMHIHVSEVALVMSGAVFVVVSYYLNHRLLDCCPDDHEH